jgi:hypothetical protein
MRIPVNREIYREFEPESRRNQRFLRRIAKSMRNRDFKQGIKMALSGK